MPTRNVVLTDLQAGLVDSLVRSGRYQNASEVLRAGLRMLEAQHREEEARLEGLRHAALAGIATLDAGISSTFADAGSLVAHLDAVADAVLGDNAGRG